MKKATLAVLSAAIVLGGTLTTAGPYVAAQQLNAQPAVTAAAKDTDATSAFQLTPTLKKYWGGVEFNLEYLNATENSTEFMISRKLPANPADLDPEIDRKITDMDYLVIDSSGWIYERQSSSGGMFAFPDGALGMRHEEAVEALKDQPQELTIKPYIGGYYDDTTTMFSDKADVKTPLKGMYPLQVDQGKIGSISVTGVDFSEDKTVVRVAAAGETAPMQTTGIWLVENGKRLDESGKKLKSVEDGIYEYELEFPAVGKNASLELLTKRMTPVTFLDNLEMTVQLPR
ncbi:MULTISPECIES: hypothetical protein [unclassified Paenibacillus]|uniref:hypothetical protein n=1 Tax=unclassified Paenibacillus TaxID=185978 RepID=UPI00020D76A0|nr:MULTISPECIES: hypothetical protein [unclassified Paenibacillus]EGL19891.1 hypothetical protein HMPREF9413_3299 [Paenibacillus sp. HGF7]EPD88606.1 hypothetical protein HMPREF1207_02035 [Paenibacillus sp. HGH0039]